MGDVGGWLVLIAFGVLLFVRLSDMSKAHRRGLRSRYDDRCKYCGKRLKFKPGGIMFATGIRESRCRACGADQPIYTPG